MTSLGVGNSVVSKTGPSPLEHAHSSSVSALFERTAVPGPRIAWGFGTLGEENGTAHSPRPLLYSAAHTCSARERSVRDWFAVPRLSEEISNSRGHEVSFPERDGSHFEVSFGGRVSPTGVAGLS